MSAADMGCEGIVLKRRISTYRRGERSQDWRKLKTRHWFDNHAEHRRPGKGGQRVWLELHDPVGVRFSSCMCRPHSDQRRYCLRRRFNLPGVLVLDANRGHASAVFRRAARWWLVARCVQFVTLGLVHAWHDAPTVDESYDLATGLTTLTRHQIRLTPEHPPLPSVLASLPVLAAHPVIPRGASWQSGNSEVFRADLMQAQARTGKLQQVMFLARLVPLAEGVAVGLLAYALAAALFGSAAGVLAGSIWLTLPMALGLGHILGADLPFALVTLLASLTLLRYVRSTITRPRCGPTAAIR